MALLEVRNLGVSFGAGARRVIAAEGVTFTLDRGETLALVGESGSGKSVTALSVLQLLPYPVAQHPPGSSVLLDGREMIGADAETLRAARGGTAGMIFQEPMTSLNPLHTIETQIGEAVLLHRPLPPAEIRARVIQCLGMAGFADAEARLGAYPHQLSGGQRQRVMIAMALANDPALLIADEPTTALDVTIQAQILELMQDLSRRLGVAMLIITHNLGVVARYADRVNVMYAGRVIERGTAEEIYANPRHPYTLGLLRSVPRLDEPRRARLDPIQGQPPDLTRLPPGCAFAPRCNYKVERCGEVPPLEAVVPAHRSACWERLRLVKERAA